MEKARTFFQTHLWLAFLLHQGLIFLLALLFLSTVRYLTGRSLHGGRDPVGWLDGAALVILSSAVIGSTWWLYHWLKEKPAHPLGLAFSFRRLVELLAGIFLGFGFIFLPWLIALGQGTATVVDRIDLHFEPVSVVWLVSIGFFLLLIQGLTEETANRAFPLRLWESRPLLGRILLPALFFAVIHLADEVVSPGRIAVLLLGGILQSFAYLLTGNIWFTSGIHTGANFAAFSVTGLWHAGSFLALAGRPAFPNWVALVCLLGVLGLGYFGRGWIGNWAGGLAGHK